MLYFWPSPQIVDQYIIVLTTIKLLLLHFENVRKLFFSLSSSSHSVCVQYLDYFAIRHNVDTANLCRFVEMTCLHCHKWICWCFIKFRSKNKWLGVMLCYVTSFYYLNQAHCMIAWRDSVYFRPPPPIFLCVFHSH